MIGSAPWDVSAMKKSTVASLGIASFVPAASAVAAVGAWLIYGGIGRLSLPVLMFWLVMWFAFLAATLYFTLRVLKAHDPQSWSQVLWLMVLLSVPPVGAPLYWWYEVRPRKHS